MNTRKIDLAKLNSLTKYPAIPTYHKMGIKGKLRDEIQVPFSGKVRGTEKIDGTNARLIFTPDYHVIVGSREDLLWERRDLIRNHTLNIVATVADLVEKLFNRLYVYPFKDKIIVLYGEVYGHNTGTNSKNYTRKDQTGFRVFDCALIGDYEEMFQWDLPKIASWRDHGGQNFIKDLEQLASNLGLEQVPFLFEKDAAYLPKSLQDTKKWLYDNFMESNCTLDDNADGVAEGVVVRSLDRKQIAKIRFEDYWYSLRE